MVQITVRLVEKKGKMEVYMPGVTHNYAK